MGHAFKTIVFNSILINSLFFFTFSTVNATTPLIYGDDLTAWINTEGESHTYTFEGNAGDRIFIRVRGTSNGVDGCIELFNPAGTSVGMDCDDGGYVAIDGYDLAVTGTYTLIVKDREDNDTGFYGLSLQVVNNPIFATLLNCQQDLIATLTHQAEIDAYAYTANAGDVLVIRMRGEHNNIEPTIRLYDPAGNILAEATPSGGTSRINTFTITANGTYIITAMDGNGNDIGNYGFSIQVINPNECADLIECGTFSADLNLIAEMHAYVFEAEAGDRIYLNMRGSEGVEAELELYDATGVEMAADNPNGGTAKIENFVIPKSGLYFVMARDRKGNDTGHYGLSFQNIGNLNCAIELNCNTNLNASIDELAELDIYYFEASAGEQVILQMRAFSNSLEGELYLYDSNGNLIAKDSPGGGLCEIAETTIQSDGVYYVIIKDKHGNDTSNYGFSFQKLDATCAIPFSCVEGIVTGNLTALSAMDAYHFTGNAGDIIHIDMIETGTDLEPLLYIYDPNHTRIVNKTASQDIHIENLELTESGTYIAYAMDRNGNDLGEYTLMIDCAAEETPPPPEYCESWGTTNGNKWIESFNIGTYTNYSGTNGGYGDYTNEVIELPLLSALTIELGPSTNDNSVRKWSIWIDYNQDGMFSDEEQAFSTSANGIQYGSIYIPPDALPGTTRLRISMKTGRAPEPCSTFTTGEVEDYTVMLTSGSNFGGSISNSSAQSKKTEPTIKCFPNPTTDYVMVDISKFNNKNGAINIYNNDGKEVFSSGKQLLSENVYQVDFKTLNMPAGIYKVAVIYGKESVSRTIFVNNE